MQPDSEGRVEALLNADMPGEQLHRCRLGTMVQLGGLLSKLQWRCGMASACRSNSSKLLWWPCRWRRQGVPLLQHRSIMRKNRLPV